MNKKSIKIITSLFYAVCLICLISQYAAAQKKIMKNSQKRDAINENSVKISGSKPQEAGQLKSNSEAPLFDSEFISRELDMKFLEALTGEVEFKRIHSSLAEGVQKFAETLKQTFNSANFEFSGFKSLNSKKFKAEADFAAAKMTANSDPARAESLKSLNDEIMVEQRNRIKSEKIKLMNKFDTLFESFLSSFKLRRAVAAKNTVYESETSEISCALDTFEAGIKEKKIRIEKYIDSNIFDKMKTR